MDVEGLGSKVWYRSRDTAVILREHEWDWTKDASKAWVFDTYEAGKGLGTYENDATTHVMGLPPAEREHSHAVVVSLAEIAGERVRREEERAERAMASARGLAPEIVYRETARRTGEREETL